MIAVMPGYTACFGRTISIAEHHRSKATAKYGRVVTANAFPDHEASPEGNVEQRQNPPDEAVVWRIVFPPETSIALTAGQATAAVHPPQRGPPASLGKIE
jgi:hypothetical protein